ncbi:MAG: hypothetical protein CVU44_12375 [Chloroflexi bacterium HGW-Chloroflexi-6]|nr:MAG: hypothetical protein CVU44_12375 [Chloroflexi bacterium HGW-Chloroflexi-6]
MSEAISIPQTQKSNPFKRIFALLLHPRQFFAIDPGGWRLPMLVVSLTLFLQTMVTGYFRAKAAAMGEVKFPPDWEWWTPEMQNNYMQAQQATQGPVFAYIIPLVGALTSLWLGWMLVSGLLHLASTLLGGRGNMGSAMGVVAWASIPFALRDMLRVIFMLAVGRAIASPGLSGFVSGSEPGMLFVGQLLGLLDVFFVWYAILTVIGFSVKDNLGSGKAALGVIGVLLLILLAQAGLGMLGQNLSGMLISRPFF